jgi:hypothetical protein
MLTLEEDTLITNQRSGGLLPNYWWWDALQDTSFQFGAIKFLKIIQELYMILYWQTNSQEN